MLRAESGRPPAPSARGPPPPSRDSLGCRWPPSNGRISAHAVGGGHHDQRTERRCRRQRRRFGIKRAGYGCNKRTAPVVAERLACADGIVRCLPGTQSVNAGTSNERRAIPPTEGLKVAAAAEARGKNQPLG